MKRISSFLHCRLRLDWVGIENSPQLRRDYAKSRKADILPAKIPFVMLRRRTAAPSPFYRMLLSGPMAALDKNGQRLNDEFRHLLAYPLVSTQKDKYLGLVLVFELH